jgi:hypothetical protein
MRKHSPVAIRHTGSWQRLEISDRSQPSGPSVLITRREDIGEAGG